MCLIKGTLKSNSKTLTSLARIISRGIGLSSLAHKMKKQDAETSLAHIISRGGGHKVIKGECSIKYSKSLTECTNKKT